MPGLIFPQLPTVNAIHPFHLTCQLPGPTGALYSFTNPNAGIQEILGPFGSQGPANYFLHVPRLAYLLQAWYQTAGRESFDTLVDAIAISGVGAVPLTGKQFRRVEIDITTKPKGWDRRGLNPGASRYGIGQFTYGGAAGRLQYVMFEHQFLEPESPGADGFNYWLPTGAAGVLAYYAISDPLPGVSTGPGLEASPDAGLWSGATVTSIPPLAYTENVNHIQNRVERVSGTVLDATNTLQIFDSYALGTSDTDAGMFALELALINEIWQTTTNPEAGTTNSGAFDCSTPQTYDAPGHVIKTGTVEIGTVITDQDYNFGKTGFPMLGHWAPRRNGYFGELRYLNSNTSRLTKLPLFCEAVWIAVKPFCTATCNFVLADTAVENSDNDIGEINLPIGKVDGLLPTI